MLDSLEEMNVRHQTEVPATITDTLEALGLVGTSGLEPMALLPRVLDQQQLLRRRLASMRRIKQNEFPQT